ncbi:nuclear receptor subfamily 2 group E member 1 isoform X2 [Cimex lectularius]|uniref:Nuclear receptor subfamily 2 group E member 1 n=1 Tax=Cimex lectularius TaxID=79782 RepID=A0A8I6TIU1_CIMLE|nr:nuclear receptor subfamily 2 group E member 1 isoform X2 [Cimex lectularius]
MSRILYDIPCKVCQDHSSGKHYGIFACDGCAGFFKRSIRRNRQYVCKVKGEGGCLVDKTHRNQCRACRLTKCLEAGMNRDAVQHERGPRNSTLRRQMCLLVKEEAGPSTPSMDLSAPNASPPHFSPFYTPQIGEVLSNPEAICESAARLLFMNVRWAKNVPAFTGLNMKDQTTLLEESWRELFLLGWAQLLPLTDLAILVANSPRLLQEAATFQDTLAKLRSLGLDHHEFACLRAVILFKTALEGEGKSLVDVASIAALQDQTQVTLNKYVSTAYPDQPYRFGKLLLLLPSLRLVSANTIEEMFFRRTIGPIPIERIICDMYRSAGAI